MKKKLILNLKLAALTLAIALGVIGVARFTTINALAQAGQTCENNQVTGAPAFFLTGGVYYGCPAGTLSQFWPVADNGLQANTSFGRTALRVAHAQYSFANDGGAIGAIVPLNNFTLPQNSVITNIAINSTTAVTSLGSATVALGTDAGTSAAALLAATAKASFTANAFVQGIPVPQTASTWLKTTASGHLQVTVATAALTAGVVEVYVWYYVSAT